MDELDPYHIHYTPSTHTNPQANFQADMAVSMSRMDMVNIIYIDMKFRSKCYVPFSELIICHYDLCNIY